MMTQTDALAECDWDIPAAAKRADDPLLDCLLTLTRIGRHTRTADALTAGLPLENGRLTPRLFIRAAARAGFAARIVRRPLDRISNLVLPAVLLLKDGQACILDRIEGCHARIIVPESGDGSRELPLDALAHISSGYAIFVQQACRTDTRSEHAGIRPARHWFGDTLYRSWPFYSEVVIAALLINLFALASPLFIMNVYDRVVPNHAVETLWVLGVGVAIIYCFDFLMRMLRGYFLDVAGRRADIVWSAMLFERVLGIRLEARPQSVGAFAGNLHEFDSFREFFTSATLTTLVDLPFVALFILVIWLLGGPLALVPLCVLPLAVAAGLVIQRMLAPGINSQLQYSSQKQAALVETLSGLEIIKGLGAEGSAQQRWEQLCNTLAGLGLKNRLLSAGAVNITLFLQQMATVCVVIYGVYLINDGIISVGGLIASTILTGRALAPMGQIAATLTRYHQARAAYQSTDAIMQAPLERPDDREFLARPVIRGNIEFRNLTFTYPGQGIPALDNVSLRIGSGEHTAIIGRIGSGKSTIGKLILGLYQPDSGAVLIDDTDMRQIDPAELRRNIGYVPQDTFLFYGSVRDNIAHGMPYVDDDSILQAARIAGVTDFVDRHPSGFDMQVGERGDRLSGGQRQSIAVARALLRDSPVLVMDEPSNAMDNSTEEQFRRRFSDWAAERTLVLVTHRASLLSLVDRIIVMDSGRIIADGPKLQVMDALKKGQIKVPRP